MPRRPLAALALFVLTAGAAALGQAPAPAPALPAAGFTWSYTVAGAAPQAVAPAPRTVAAAPAAAPDAAPAPKSEALAGLVGGAAASLKPAGKGDAKTAEAKPPAKPTPSPRLTKLKALTFDRRPSAVLKTWSAPPKSKDAKDDEPAAPAPPPDGQQPGPPGQPGQPGGDAAAPAQSPAEAKKLADELAAFQKMVQLGEWARVKDYLATLPDEEAVAGFTQLAKSLQSGPPRNQQQPNFEGMDPDQAQMLMMQQNGPGQQYAERNALTLDDFFGLANAAPLVANPAFVPQRAAVVGALPVALMAPKGFDKPALATLAGVLQSVVGTGALPEVVVARFQAEKGPFAPREVAKLLVAANLPAFAGPFLPTPEKASAEGDFEGLNLLARHFVSLHAKEQKAGNLEKAWHAVQSVLANPTAKRADQEESLLRAVELAPRVEKELGQAWLDGSFTKEPARGAAILAAVGTLTAQGIAGKPYDIASRLNALKLQRTAVEALLKAAPAKAGEWGPTLTLLALAWQKEAEFSRQHDRTAGGSRVRRDIYGNIYYSSSRVTSSGGDDDDNYQQMMYRQQNLPMPVLVADVLKECPGTEWVAAVNPGVRPKLADLLARLHLKAGDEEKAFPLIEELAKSQPEEARELVKEFVRVWTRSHDPNASRNENRYSWFFFSFEQRAEGIPLTRSKQERNLADLAKWLGRVRKLPVRPLDDDIQVKAFTACHSSAEVYKTEAIQAVFGPLETLRPGTISGLAQQMRENLTSIWRKEDVQTQSKTNRKKKDIEAEVLRGYAVARQTVADGLAKFPGEWSLLTAEAALLHDEVNYRQELEKAADFSAKRAASFDLFAKAAEAYAKAVGKLPDDEQSNTLFNQWFAAGLGAVDLGGISEEKQPDAKQPARVKAALDALPGVAAKKHLDRFANDLFTRMSGAKPHVKFAYLKAGFEVVGDHPQAAEARKLYDYYGDLNRELKLESIVDGSTEVGHGRPFGVFVNLKHTRDIERESGGFGKYLQNQTTMGYSYNYGRPPADYRDRFEQATREALKEQFEVLGVTFQDDKVTSRAGSEYGWRYTPYAYLLLKARGPHVDKLPALKMDLDFLDTSGFVVLPATSSAVAIDCRPEKGATRPAEDISVAQTLDERQAEKGILILEVKASAIGLVPDLAELAGAEAPAGFDIAKTEEVPLAVKKFDSERDRNAVVSERVWTITLKATDGAETLPTEFTFPRVLLPTKESLFQRYSDADLAAVGAVVSLEKTYGKANRFWLRLAAAGAVLGLAALVLGAVLVRRGMRGAAERRAARGRLPADPTALQALTALRELRDGGRVPDSRRAELDRDIDALEAAYFSPESAAVDLRAAVAKWA